MKMKLVLITAVLGFSVSSFAQGQCLFGETTVELRENKRFTIKEDVIRTFKVWRSTEPGATIHSPDDKPPMVSVSIVTDKKTGNVYHLNETFRHTDDGDNTQGWIEEVNNAENLDSGYDGEGRVVANIGDQEISDCQVLE